MQLKNGLFIGIEGKKYTLHNNKKFIYLKTPYIKDNKENEEKAKKEAEKYKQK